MFNSLSGDAERLIDECIQLSYFMRGAVPYEDMMRRTPGERNAISRFVEKRLDQEAKSPHPVY